jgi:hypothetical protein
MHSQYTIFPGEDSGLKKLSGIIRNNFFCLSICTYPAGRIAYQKENYGAAASSEEAM